MERRTLLQWVAAVAAWPLIRAVPAGRTVYGSMDVGRWFADGFYSRGAKAFLDGQDITPVCRWFNDITGEAECYVTGPDGEIVMDGDDLAVEMRRGRIDVLDKGDATWRPSARTPTTRPSGTSAPPRPGN